MRAIAFIASALALAAGAATASTPVETKVTEVTVYSRGARVIKTGQVVLKAGPAVVEFSGIPATATDSSIRLAVEGPKGTKYYGVKLKSVYTPEYAEERINELRKKVEELQEQKEDLEDQVKGRGDEMEIIKSLGKQSASAIGSGGAKAADVAGLASATESVGRKLQSLLSANRKDQRAMKDLDRKISALQKELNDIGAGNLGKKTAEAELELPKEGPVDFTLSYMLTDCSWSPVYDLRLDAAKAKPEVRLTFGANVIQRSGEDWNGVKLTLSTARPEQGTQIPDPSNWWLDFMPEPRPVYRATAKRSVAMEAAAPQAAGYAPEEDKVAVEMEQAETARSEYATSFNITRAVTVPSDGSSHRVGISEGVHPASLTLVAVPRLAQAAFIEAKVDYDGEEALMPGPANLFLGDDFSGLARLESTAPGESFTLGFGQDGNFKVERKLLTKKSGGRGVFIWTKTERTYNWVTTIENYHEGARTIEVREQLPRSRQEKIVVAPLELSPTALPDDPQRPGLKRWSIDVPAKGKAKVVFSYSVKFPENARVYGLE